MWRRAAAGYRECYPTPAVSTWDDRLATATALPRRRVHLSGWIDVPVRTDQGDELRQIDLRSREPVADPLRSPTVLLAVLRLAQLGRAGHLTIRTGDLLGRQVDVAEVDLDADGLAPLAGRLDELLASARAQASSGQARPGSQCVGCPFVAGCPPHRHP